MTGLLDLLDAVAESNSAALELWNHLSEPELLRRLLLEEPVDHAACERLLQRASTAAAEWRFQAAPSALPRSSDRGRGKS